MITTAVALATAAVLAAPSYGGPPPVGPDPIEPGTVWVHIWDDDQDRALSVCDWVADTYGVPWRCEFDDAADAPAGVVAPAWRWVIPPAGR